MMKKIAVLIAVGLTVVSAASAGAQTQPTSHRVIIGVAKPHGPATCCG